MQFIHKHQVPDDKQVTCTSHVYDCRPLKDEQHRVKITVGGDKQDCKHDAGSLAANLLETKTLLNSVTSDSHRGTQFMSTDIKDHFLATPIDDPECMKVDYKCILDDVRFRHKLDQKVTKDGQIYIMIQKGMLGLKQAATLAYCHLKTALNLLGISLFLVLLERGIISLD